MTAGKGRLVNDSHIKGQLVNDGHSKGQLVNDGHSKVQLVNDGHKFDSFWGHCPTFTALYLLCGVQHYSDSLIVELEMKIILLNELTEMPVLKT